MFTSPKVPRRSFLATSAAAAASLLFANRNLPLLGQEKGDRPKQDPSVTVLNPQARVPVSLIIDDSTCLVNLAHFCIPQFAEVFPDRYKQDWRKLPREIPDAFVRKFGEWCHEHGVKGKYSIVPYPACVGWVDRDMPGWTGSELEESLQAGPRLDDRPTGTSTRDGHAHLGRSTPRPAGPYPERDRAVHGELGLRASASRADELAELPGLRPARS